jgi:adenylate kinase family enzyme
MRIAITGPSGSGKTTLSRELGRAAGLRQVEIDAKSSASSRRR